jgi:hypothetical protein
MRTDLPEFKDWSIAAIRLLQGVVEVEDGRVWNLVLSNLSILEGYFARLGLRLVVDESEGLAYLKQFGEDEMPEGYESLPKLFRSTRLSYGQTLLCVLLRDELRRFEEEDTHNDRCVVEEAELLEQWKPFFPQQDDDVRHHRELHGTLRKLEELGFVKKLDLDPPSWEVRRTLKVRVTAAELEHLQRQLSNAMTHRDEAEATPSEDELPG